MVLLEFAMSPTGQGESLSAQVARVLDVIDRSGVPYQVTPMGTILEGEWDEVMAVVTACFKTLQAECPRIGMNLKMDWRAGRRGELLLQARGENELRVASSRAELALPAGQTFEQATGSNCG